MTCIRHQLLGNNPSWPRFLRDLSDAMYYHNKEDIGTLNSTKKIVHQRVPEGIPHAERNFLHVAITSTQETKNQVLKVFVVHVQLDLLGVKKFFLFDFIFFSFPFFAFFSRHCSCHYPPTLWPSGWVYGGMYRESQMHACCAGIVSSLFF